MQGWVSNKKTNGIGNLDRFASFGRKNSSNPIFDGGFFCPSPIKYNDKYYIFACHFVGNTNYSEIELYECDNPTFHLSQRKLLRVVKSWVPGSSWQANVLDPAYVLTDNISRDSFSSSKGELWMYYGANTGTTRGIGLCIEPLEAALLKNGVKDERHD